jgi:hypothetical protein
MAVVSDWTTASTTDYGASESHRIRKGQALTKVTGVRRHTHGERNRPDRKADDILLNTPR